jgi:hypothetical protein
MSSGIMIKPTDSKQLKYPVPIANPEMKAGGNKLAGKRKDRYKSGK